MNRTAFLFPGQGSQFVGMGKDLYEQFAEARKRFERADDVLGFSLSAVMFGSGMSDDEASAALRQTDVTQPALYLHSLASAAVIRAINLKPGMAAGHSLGEYSALAATGAITFEDGLNIVRLRGRLMAEAGELRRGTMAAVLGMEDKDVVSICFETSKSPDSVVEAANFNAPGQVVISGDVDAVERAMDLAKERGARRVVQLPVSGAFHSPLMEHARSGLADALVKLEIVEPECPVYLNVTAAPTRKAEEIRRYLLEQLMAPVRWTQTLRAMESDGASHFVEIGAGNVLAGLARRTLGRDVEASAAGNAEELKVLGTRYPVPGRPDPNGSEHREPRTENREP